MFGDLFVDTEIALAMAVKKAGLSQELHPKDVRKSSQGKKLAVLQHTQWFPHLYRAYSGIYGPAYLWIPQCYASQGTQWLQNPHKPEL